MEALQSFAECKMFAQWLGPNVAAAASSGLTPAILAALEKKYFKAAVISRARQFRDMSDYEVVQVMTEWSNVAKNRDDDMGIVTLLLEEAVVQQLMDIVVDHKRMSLYRPLLSFLDLLQSCIRTHTDIVLDVMILRVKPSSNMHRFSSLLLCNPIM